MLSVYQAAALSKRESPVLNGAPREGSFAGKSCSVCATTSAVRVELSIIQWPIKLTNAAFSASAESFSPRRVPLNVLPSFTCNAKRMGQVLRTRSVLTCSDVGTADVWEMQEISACYSGRRSFWDETSRRTNRGLPKLAV